MAEATLIETEAPPYLQGHIIEVGKCFAVETPWPVRELDPDRAFSNANVMVCVEVGRDKKICFLPHVLKPMDTRPVLGKYFITSIDWPERGAITAHQIIPDSLQLGRKIIFRVSDDCGRVKDRGWPKILNMDETNPWAAFFNSGYVRPNEPKICEMKAGDVIEIAQGMPINVFCAKGVEGIKASGDHLGKYAVQGFEQRTQPEKKSEELKDNGRIYTLSKLFGGNGHSPAIIFMTYDKRTGLLPIYAEDVEFVG